MGTWGKEVLEDDLALDVYGDFIEQYNDKVELLEIRRFILDSYSECLAHHEMHTKVWIGLSIAEWECGWLQSETYQELIRAISKGDDISLWPPEERDERAQVLADLLAKLKDPPKKARRRIKRKVPAAFFEPGACLAIKLFNGYWGAAIVLDLMETPYDTLHLLGGLKGNFREPPTMEVFEGRGWEVMTHHNWKGTLLLSWCGSSHYKKETKGSLSTMLIGKTKLREDEPTLENPFGIGGSWFCIENGIRMQHEWDASEPHER